MSPIIVDDGQQELRFEVIVEVVEWRYLLVVASPDFGSLTTQCQAFTSAGRFFGNGRLERINLLVKIVE